jgi:FkbM family methyltransferase
MSMTPVMLPNGAEIFEINPHETRFLYDEIFVQNVYASYDLAVPPGGLVLDIGANIGMFALYVANRFPGAEVWCFEPAPHCLERLTLNLGRLKAKTRVFPVALGASEGIAEFSYYPHYSIISGMFADESQDMEVLRAGARTLYVEKYKRQPDERELDFLTGAKLNDRQVFDCTVRPLSKVLIDEGLPRVSLAKIDVERAENIILQGIDDKHWAMIDQFVVEVHDQGNREHELMAEKLRGHGYRTNIFVEPALKNSGIYVLVAKR